MRIDAPVTRAGAQDIDIRWGERRAIPNSPPDGVLLARLDFPDTGSSLTAGPDGYLWRINGLCEFAVDPARRHATVHLAPGADEEEASLFAGSFLAKMLALDGHCVLHASAVEFGRRAVAFVGAEGMGKTTVAALCCIAGARVVTDDALRVEVIDGAGWCYRGSRELRLRPGAASLAAKLDWAPRRSTLDSRTAIDPGAADADRFPLAAVVAPRCMRDAAALRLERLRGAAAVVELLRYPRTVGWNGAQHSRSDLAVLADLASSVPIYRAELPWAPSVDPVLGEMLLTCLGFELGGEEAQQSRLGSRAC